MSNEHGLDGTTQQQEKGWFNELEDGAQIKDVREAFVKQHEPDVRRATVEVRETRDGEMLKPNSKTILYPQRAWQPLLVQEKARIPSRYRCIPWKTTT